MFRSFALPPLAALVSTALVAGIAGCANSGAMSSSAATPAARLPVLTVFGDRGAVAPYTLFLGTPAQLSSTVPQNGTAPLDAGAIKVEPTQVGDLPGARFTWTGGVGQFQLQSPAASDLLDYVEANAAMVFDTIVHKAPEDPVMMRVDCRYPCFGVVDMTHFFRNAPLGRQLQVKMPLSCFETSGTKFTAVNTPLVIMTTKPFGLSVANVRYVPGAAKDVDALKCTP